MLVVSRKNQESVAIASTDGDSCLVKVTIVEIRGDRVRLGFEANLDVPVHRWEVWQRIVEQRGRARNGASSGNDILEVTSDILEVTAVEGTRRLEPGDLVRINDGAFAGVEGTVATRGTCRVIVDVNMIQRGVSIEIDAHLLEPIRERHAVAPVGEISD